MWDIINPEVTFAGHRKFMAEEACLPLIFPQLRRPGNAPDKLVAAFQFVGYFGRKDAEVGPNAVAGERAGREGINESWHVILWKCLLYSFCISCQ